MKCAALPRTARDLIALSRTDALRYGAVVAFAEATGIWEYPRRSHADLARMTFLDKAFWMYKAARPTRRARRGSGIEAYFAERRGARAELPPGFRVDAELALSAVGDLTSHAYLADSKDVLYREVSDLLFDVDLSMANLECVVCPPVVRELVIRPDEGPALYHDRASFVAARGPSGEGFRFVAAACNHSLDFGEVGVDSTVRALEEAGIAYAELTARGADPCRATILERRGLRVGVVAYTFGLNAHRPPEDRPQIVHQMALNDGVAGCDFGQVTRQIEHCRSEDVDFIVAQLHWGLEHEHYPVPEQVELAHHLAELGVDAILGHHPHVVQPMELYRTKRDPRRLVPIYYSRGNLITPFSALHACTSYVARITIAKGAVGDEPPSAYVGSAEVVEVRQVADDARGQIRIVRLPRA